MSLSTTDAVREVFARALQHSLQKALRTPEDWDRYKAIIQETDARLEAEERAHARDFPQRMAEAKEIILREEHSIRLDQPLPPGVEKHSDADALDRKAGARVRQDQAYRRAMIRKDELDQYRDLTADIRARDAPPQQFGQSVQQTHKRTSPTRS